MFNKIKTYSKVLSWEILNKVGILSDDRVLEKWEAMYSSFDTKSKKEQQSLIKTTIEARDCVVDASITWPENKVFEVLNEDIRTARIEYNFLAQKVGDPRSKFLAARFNDLSDVDAANKMRTLKIYRKAAGISNQPSK